MITVDKKNPKNWTPEERGRVVKVFEWLLKEDKKQNPHLYKKPRRLGLRRYGKLKLPNSANLGLINHGRSPSRLAHL